TPLHSSFSSPRSRRTPVRRTSVLNLARARDDTPVERMFGIFGGGAYRGERHDQSRSSTTDTGGIPGDVELEETMARTPMEENSASNQKQDESERPDAATRSPVQRAIMDCIRASLEAKGYPPTMREIATAVGLDRPSSVKYQLELLELKGFLRRDALSTRAI